MKKYRLIILICTIIMSIFGLIMIYSSSSIWAEYNFGSSFYFLRMQIMYLLISFLAMFIISRIDSKFFYDNASKFLLITFILLILVLFLGTIKNGSRSWFKIGPFSMQPSEFSKIALIIFTSKYLSKNNKLLPILIVIFLFFSLILLQPDFGSGMVMLLSILVLLFASGADLSFFYKIIILGIIGVSIIILIAPYRVLRIISFINPWSDPLGSGFQIIQSLYAIGPSGLFGTGLFSSIQKQFYLPEPQTDFIFSIICEELGIFGSIMVVSLFLILFYYILKISFRCNDLFKKYLILGLGISIILQAFLNICVVVGLIPVTGVTLPFFSYGGSSLLTVFISIGIIFSLTKKDL